MIRIRPTTDPDIAATAVLVGEPSRAAMLAALADGRALPAGLLARIAGITPQTASNHLDRLVQGRLVAVEAQGRHRYYRLRDARVASLLEALAVVAPPAPTMTDSQDERGRALRFARTCYDHLAGRLGVTVTQALCTKQLLHELDGGYDVAREGIEWLRRLGIDTALLKRRPLTRRCLDWSERRHHLAGALGVALARRTQDLGWVVPVRDSRALRLTDRGREALQSELDLDL